MAKVLFAVRRALRFPGGLRGDPPEQARRPGGSSAKKKLKDKAFARAVNREDIQQGAAEAGFVMDDHIGFVITALKHVAPQLGLGEGIDLRTAPGVRFLVDRPVPGAVFVHGSCATLSGKCVSFCMSATPRSKVSGRIPSVASFRPFFWDCNSRCLSLDTDADFVVGRLLAEGDWDSIRWLRLRAGDQALCDWLNRYSGRGLSPSKAEILGLASA